MRVLLDTNVVLDAIARREPFWSDAQKIINLILDNKITGYITANSVVDIHYIARKHLSKKVLRDALRSLFKIFNVLDVFGADCFEALDFPLDDYEDTILMICSDRAQVDYIITRDKEFLRKTKSSAIISPADFIKKINKL